MSIKGKPRRCAHGGLRGAAVGTRHRDDFLVTRLVTRNALDARQKPDAAAAEISRSKAS
jgi:hypothetical protein